MFSLLSFQAISLSLLSISGKKKKKIRFSFPCASCFLEALIRADVHLQDKFWVMVLEN